MSRVVLIPEPTKRMIDADCLAHPGVETGGALDGFITDTLVLALFTAPAGPRAHRSAIQFRPSPRWQQRYIDYLFERFAVNFIGDWHRHPSHVPTPSATDLATAQAIVASPRWNTPQAIFPIATLNNDQVSIRAFFITRERPEFEELPVLIVRDSDPRVTAALTGQPQPRKEDNGHAASDDQCGRDSRRARLGRFVARLRLSPRS